MYVQPLPLRLLPKPQKKRPTDFDDSYAVNSASLGPWGDAIMYELLPVIEQRFRGIGEGWARFTYGAHQQSSSYTSPEYMYSHPHDFCAEFIRGLG